ncbi:MAG TPA: zinc ABC transporter substrate-binding protein [Pelolinea sp.]|nr:zinc ABC transporter substrate-binding protein [Pelolinea sp.]
MRRKFLISLLALLILIAVSACASGLTDSNEGRFSVTVSVLPEKYFVERIGGELVSVNVMVGPGDSPHTYEPKPEQMAALSRSVIYFSIGVEFEGAWMDKIASANPKMRIVNLSDGIRKIQVAESINSIPQSDGQGEPDPHVWTSPALVKDMAQKIFEEISNLDPNNRMIYQSNLDNFLFDIDQLEKDIHASLDGLKEKRFLVFHPSWGYFAEEFGFEEIAIEIGGTEPSASELAAIIDTGKKEQIRVVFAQPEFSTQIAEYIANEIGGEVVLISPLAENWLENLRQVSQTFSKLL